MSVDCSSNYHLPEIRISKQLLLRHASWLMRQNKVADHNLSILLVDDEEISWLNNHYRKIPGPTNVLSFPLSESPLQELGDIVISIETAVKEAVDEKEVSLHSTPDLAYHPRLTPSSRVRS